MGETEWSPGGTGPKSGVGSTLRGPGPRRLSWEREPPGRRLPAAGLLRLRQRSAPSERRGSSSAPARCWDFPVPDSCFFRDASNLHFYVKSPLLKANNQINFQKHCEQTKHVYRPLILTGWPLWCIFGQIVNAELPQGGGTESAHEEKQHNSLGQHSGCRILGPFLGLVFHFSSKPMTYTAIPHKSPLVA